MPPMGMPPMGGPPMGMPMGAPMGPPMVHPMMPQPGFPGAPMMPGQPMPYGQPMPPQYAGAQPRVITQGAVRREVVQKAPEQQPITVTLTGRQGVNDVVNGTYTSCGEYNGRYYFMAQTNEGPIYLYYDQGSDNWCIGEQLGSQSYYAVCGPSEGQDMAQQWRIWTGEAWEDDPNVGAEIQGA